MLLSPAEFDAVSRVQHRDPHSLLGMHPLGDRPGIVVRAFVPGATCIEVKPVHDRSKPTFPLQRLGDSCVFEAVTTAAHEVYAYDLVIHDDAGNRRQGRDPYSFLPTLGDVDLHLFGEGNHRHPHDCLGSHLRVIDGVAGTSFAVWAPNAQRVSVVGTWNQWDGRVHSMRMLGSSGIWELFIPGIGEGSLYQFEIVDAHGVIAVKTDPFGSFFERAPKHAAIVWDNRKFRWTDDAWMARRRRENLLRRPVSIYEVHLGSWRKKSASESLSYSEVAAPLIHHVKQLGFTHVEFLPPAEHAYYPSWGYQVTGFFAPTSRFGTPDDFQFLINALHEAGIGVIIDWVPAHFPRDTWALANFDGTALFEHADPRQGAHQDWGTLIFNFGRQEVRNFLTANALFWCEHFHIDGLRVDAVASMLYLDYSRAPGEWVPNRHGGRENLEAVDFLRHVNHLVHTQHPGVLTIAEESTAWPQVSRPPENGGLGFSLKWNMGWMHDTLGYFKRDPIHRKHHQNELTFAMLYHHNENFVLPLSHDEVVHGKGSLRRRMPGDDWQAFANLRTLLGYQWLFPGKKLLFMGGEFGQTSEWSENGELDWWLRECGLFHAGLQSWVADLNTVYRNQAALWAGDFEHDGFQWIDCADEANSVLSFVRRPGQAYAGHGATESGELVIVLNLTPVPRSGYRIGFPAIGPWREILNSDAASYGGSGLGNGPGIVALPAPSHGQPASVRLTLPPMSVVVFAVSH